MHTFLQFDEENWKKYRIMSKKLIFVQTYKIYVAPWQRQKIIDIQLMYQNFRDGWMNSYWNFQPFWVNRHLKTLKKKPYVGKKKKTSITYLIEEHFQE